MGISKEKQVTNKTEQTKIVYKIKKDNKILGIPILELKINFTR